MWYDNYIPMALYKNETSKENGVSILNNEMADLLRGILQEELAPVHQRLTAIEGDMAVLKQDVAGLKQDVAGLKQDVSVLKQDVAGLKQDVSVLKQDVAGLKQDMAQVMQASLETNQIVTRMEATQEGHERILDLLSRRSIEQEANLKRIK